jgi:hypothetical protein
MIGSLTLTSPIPAGATIEVDMERNTFIAFTHVGNETVIHAMSLPMGHKDTKGDPKVARVLRSMGR